jgi:predicted phage tail protein
MTYWGGDQIVAALADMPRDVDYTITAQRDRRCFNYSSSTSKSRYTNALVSWSDPRTLMQMQWSLCLSRRWWLGTDSIS